MPSAQRIATITACLLLAPACGRGQLDATGLPTLGEGADVGGPIFSFDGSFGPSDGTVLVFDGGLGPGFDGSIRPDAGGFRPDASSPRDGSVARDVGPRDSGAPFECQAEVDCFSSFGVPRCPNGPGRWQCIEGLCNPDCPSTNCQTDCDCPFDQSCTPMGCALVNRPNFCCANPMCPPGQTCIEPNGRLDQCGGGFPDAGPPDSGRPRRDGGGPRPDGASFDPDATVIDPDGSVIGSDASIFDPDGSVIDPDASISDPDGAVMNPDGSVVVPDGGNLSCGSDCDCDPALACIAGACQPAGRNNQCCSNPMCPAGQRCVQPDGTPGLCGPPTPVGAACDPVTMQCGAAGFCIDEQSGFPGGYCSQPCDRRSPCPAGAECRNSGGGGGAFCLDQCTQPSDCRMGYNCIQLGVGMGSRVCWPVPEGSMNPNGAPVGAGCNNDQDCDSGMSCLREQGFPMGYCTRLYCDPVNNPCPGSSACYAFPGLFSLCLETCANAGTQSTCRPRYYCLGPVGGSGVCVGN